MRVPERQWVERQLHAADIDPSIEQAVLDLMGTLAGSDLSPADVPMAAEIFAQLAQGRHIAAEPVDGTASWQQAIPGQLRPGDRVRVRAHAFSGSVGDVHNGREGVVIEAAGGDVLVRTTDARMPRLGSAHYSPHALEVWQA